MKVPKLFIDDNGKAHFDCPHCGTTVPVDTSEFHGLSNAVKVKCSCEREFRVCLGFRKGARKSSFLRGYYIKLPKGQEKGRIRVRDVAIGGIRFTTWNDHNLKAGDKIWVKFILEDHKNSEIERTARVRWVKGLAVGCEFADHRDMDSDLGFFVMEEPLVEPVSDFERHLGSAS
jgi:hypothetical protein